MPDTRIRNTLQQAIAHQQAGRLSEAEALYRQILASAPGHPDALHLLGLLAQQAGRPDAAGVLIGQAISARPDYAPFHSNLGNVLLAQNRVQEAMASFERALALDPGLADAHNNLGNAQRAAGRPDEAAASYQRALRLRPGFAEASNNLGLLLVDSGQPGEAIRHIERAIAAREDFAEAHNNLGMAQEAAGRVDEAIASLHRALALRPGYAEAHNNLGNALKAAGRFDEAVASYRAALDLRSGYAEAWNNLGLALQDQRRIEDALDSFRRAQAARPGFAEAHWNEALARLLKGDFGAGWPLYEWRWQALGSRRLVRDFAEPRWLGDAPLEGRTLLVHYEQGFGDTLQMLRYVPLLESRGARVVVEVPPSLASLAASLPGSPLIVAEGAVLPPFDLQCPLMSLPMAFGTTLATVPARVPYLHAPDAARARWRDRLGAASRARIGLAWAGSAGHTSAMRLRTLPLERLLPLLEAGAEFVSLQKDYPAGERERLLADGRICDFSGEIADFADTAALIEQCDLVISVDTAVAHLAGAMAKPVWLLLPAVPDYRWMLDREDSPWYPTMRLFRQASFGDWVSVLDRLVAELRAISAVPGVLQP